MSNGIIFKSKGEVDVRLGGQTLPAGSIPLMAFELTFSDSVRLLHDQINRSDMKKSHEILFDALTSGCPDETDPNKVWDYEGAMKIKEGKFTLFDMRGRKISLDEPS